MAVKKANIFLITFVILLCLAGVSQAATYTIEQLTDNSYYIDTNPQINENGYIAWMHYDCHDDEIMLYNGVEITQLTDNAVDDRWPQIDNNGNVVWEGDREIYLYNGSTVTHLSSESQRNERPKINDRGHVAWRGEQGGKDCIFLYDGVDVKQIATDFGYAISHEMNKDGHITWSAGTNEGYKVYLYNGSAILELTPGGYYPKINNSGNVIWQTADEKIFLYDGSKATMISNAFCDSRYPEMSNTGYAFWQRGGVGKVVYYDGLNEIELWGGGNFIVRSDINDHGVAVWDQGDTRGSEICLYDGYEMTWLTLNSISNWHPKINDKGWIVWGGSHGIFIAKPVFPDLNEPPTLEPITDKTAVINRPLKFKVKARDPNDPETPWGNIRYTIDNLPHGAVFDAETQIFCWTPSESDKGKHEITFSASDSDFTAGETVNITTVYIEEYRMTDDLEDQINPKIYRNKIAWEDKRNGDSDIYAYDLLLGEEIPIVDAAQDQCFPDIYEDKVVWQDYQVITPSIYFYDFANGESAQISAGSRHHTHPTIYGDRVVWQSAYGMWGDPDIYMYDFSTQEQTRLTEDSEAQYSPAIFGDRVCWYSYQHGGTEIYAYDLIAKNEIQLTSDTVKKYNPAIHEDKIVWDTHSSGYGGGIWSYDFATNKQMRIVDYPGIQQSPSIFGDKTVWHDQRTVTTDYDCYDIFLYDSLAEKEIRITVNDKDQRNPDIYQNRIVWQDNRYGNYDIFMADVFYYPEIASVSPSAVSPDSFITMVGKNFGYTQGNSEVLFSGGIIMPVESWSDSEIVCKIPESADSGLLSVVTKGGESNEVEVIVIVPIASAPSALTSVAVSSEQIDLTWQDNSDNEDGFKIERSLDGVSFEEIATIVANTATYSDTGLNSGTTYYYRICAYNTAGNSEYLDTAEAATQYAIYINRLWPHTKIIPGRHALIIGNNFGHKDSFSKVQLKSKDGGDTYYAKVFLWRDHYIRYVVPDLPAGKYNLRVVNRYGQSNAQSIGVGVIVRIPRISFLKPFLGLEGRTMMLYGRHFGDLDENSKVYIYDADTSECAQIISWSDRVVKFKVPKLPGGRWKLYKVRVITDAGWSNSRYFLYR